MASDPGAASRLDRWMFRAYEVPARSAALYRILFASGVLLLLPPRWRFISAFPDSFFKPPPGPTFFFFAGFPGPLTFEALNVVVVFAAVALLFGWRTRLASLALAAALLAGNAWDYSFGKINHDLLFALVPLVMAFSGWGDALSVDARERTAPPRSNGWPLALLAFLVGFGMATAGWAKLAGGWLDPSSQATHGQLVYNYFVMGRQDGLASAALALDAPFLWELLDVSTVVLELALLPAALSRGTFRLNLALLTFFHLSVLLVLRIEFPANLLGYAAFVDWDAAARRLPRALRATLARAPRPGPLAVALTATALAWLTLVGANPLAALRPALGTAMTVVAALVGAGYLVALARLLRTDRAALVARFRLPTLPA